MTTNYLLQAPPQGGGTFQLLLLTILIGIVFFTFKYMRKKEVKNSNTEDIENFNEQILLIFAKYRNGFSIIIISTIIQLINTYNYINSLNSNLRSFRLDTNMDSYFNDIKSDTNLFVVFSILSIVLYLLGFIVLWDASKLKRK